MIAQLGPQNKSAGFTIFPSLAQLGLYLVQVCLDQPTIQANIPQFASETKKQLKFENS